MRQMVLEIGEVLRSLRDWCSYMHLYTGRHTSLNLVRWRCTDEGKMRRGHAAPSNMSDMLGRRANAASHVVHYSGDRRDNSCAGWGLCEYGGAGCKRSIRRGQGLPHGHCEIELTAHGDIVHFRWTSLHTDRATCAMRCLDLPFP